MEMRSDKVLTVKLNCFEVSERKHKSSMPSVPRQHCLGMLIDCLNKRLHHHQYKDLSDFCFIPHASYWRHDGRISSNKITYIPVEEINREL